MTFVPSLSKRQVQAIVFDSISSVAVGYPSQPGHDGQFLTTNGSSVSWSTPTASIFANGSIGNEKLAHSSLTVNGTTISLGGSGTISVDPSSFNNGSISNSKLQNYAITINGTSVALGGSTTVYAQGAQPATPTAAGAVYGITNDANTAIGNFALNNNSTGNSNTAVGGSSLGRNTTGYSNAAVGANSLNQNTTGNRNTSIGANTLQFTNTDDNTAVGAYALSGANGEKNTAVGVFAIQYISGGSQNTALGHNAGNNTYGGSNNILIGYNAQSSSNFPNNEITLGNGSINRFRIPGLGIDWTSSTIPSATPSATSTVLGTVYGYTLGEGSSNTYLGHYAGYQNTTAGGANTGIGSNAMFFNTSGGGNTAVGSNALQNLTTGFRNIGLGASALMHITSGQYNVAVGGYGALWSNTTGNQNVAIGNESLYSNTTGYENVASGYLSMRSNTTGTQNTAYGAQSLRDNTTGSSNVAVGNLALAANTTSGGNVAVGVLSLYKNTIGEGNVAVGSWALFNSKVLDYESRNVGIGYSAGQEITTGRYNTAIGYAAGMSYSGGFNLTTGSNNILIGNQASSSSSSVSNEITLGNSSISRFRIPGLGIDWTSSTVPTALPSQSGNSGKFLTTNGTTTSWATAGASEATPTTAGTLRGYSSSSNNNTGLGNFALQARTTGDNNTALGTGAAMFLTTGSNNIAIGQSAYSNATTSYGNIAIGRNTIAEYNGAVWNTAVGHDALWLATTGAEQNTAIGHSALSRVSSGINNVGLGSFTGAYESGTMLTTGSNNILIGFKATVSSSSVDNEVTIGNGDISRFRIPGLGIDWTSSTIPGAVATTFVRGTVYGLTDSDNTVIGNSSFQSNTSGIYNSVLGNYSLAFNTTGSGNAALGMTALYRNTSGYVNTAVGSDALYSNTTGFSNVAIGNGALSTNTSGHNNIGIGANAYASSTTVSNEITIGNDNHNRFRIPGLGLDTSSASNGQALTWSSLGGPYGTGGFVWATPGSSQATPTSLGTVYGLANGSINDYSIGFNSLTNASSVDAGGNNAFGGWSMSDLTTGHNNNSLGLYSMQSITTGYGNIAIGSSSLVSLTTGANNIAIGMSSLSGNGNKNVAIGRYAGSWGGRSIDGDNNIVIGAEAVTSSSSVSNEITLGNSSITTLRAQVTSITSLSDARDKTNIEPLNIGLDFIKALNPVKFEWNMRDGAKVGVEDFGFIAQDIAKLEDSMDGHDWLQLTLRNNPDKLEATQGRLIPVLVKAIQDLSKKVEELEEKLNGTI